MVTANVTAALHSSQKRTKILICFVERLQLILTRGVCDVHNCFPRTVCMCITRFLSGIPFSQIQYICTNMLKVLIY